MFKNTKSTLSDALAMFILIAPLVSAFFIGGKVQGWN